MRRDADSERVEQVVLDGTPMPRVTDRYGYHVGYYRSVEELPPIADVASLVEVHP